MDDLHPAHQVILDRLARAICCYAATISEANAPTVVQTTLAWA